MHLQGSSSLMSCNLSLVSESLLFLQRALAFSAYTWFLDPMSLVFGEMGGVAHWLLEALRQALAGSVAAWQLDLVQ